MNESDLKKIRELVEEIMYSSTKKEAENAIKVLKYKILFLEYSIDSDLLGKLKDAAIYSEEASGRVKNKEHRITCARDSLIEFESRIRAFNKTWFNQLCSKSNSRIGLR